MKEKLVAFILFLISFANSQKNCSISEEAKQFKKKNILNRYPNFKNDPYNNQTNESMAIINETLNNKQLVCAMRYRDETKKFYTLKNFRNKREAILNGFIVTHQGRCGACSNLKDLAVYLSENLTVPIRRCAILSIISNKLAEKCIKKQGFTTQCSEIWLYNSINTRKNCFWVCMKEEILHTPFNKPDGSLNDCLQCDEDKSGPIFKFYSGRTRRNSGITSSINRPKSEFYNMTHCYY